MSDNTTIAVVVGSMFLMVTIGGCITTWAEHELDMEATKAGLQQCQVKDRLTTHIVWQRECVDNQSK